MQPNEQNMTPEIKIGKIYLCRKKGDFAYQKKYVIDYLPSANMVSFGDSKYSEAVYYFNVNDWDIKEI